MRRISEHAMMIIVLGGLLGCAGRQVTQTVWVPPRIDLKQHELIGVVEFASKSAGELSPLLTRKFVEAARRDQGIVRMVELPSETGNLRKVGSGTGESESFRALGRKHGLKTILTGALTVSKVRPEVRVSTIRRSGRVTALVDATLEVRMIETSTGASIWSRSATATRRVGQVSVFGGKKFVFDAKNPERAYGDLVDDLVERVTRDFHGTWEQAMAVP